MESVKILHDSDSLGLCRKIENHLTHKGMRLKRELIDHGFSLHQISDFHGSTKVVVVLVGTNSIVSRWGRTLFGKLLLNEDASGDRAIAVLWTKLNPELLTSITRTFFYPRSRVREIAAEIQKAVAHRETM